MYIFAIPASTAIDIVAITIENILTLLNVEIIKPATEGKNYTALYVIKQINIKRDHHKFIV